MDKKDKEWKVTITVKGNDMKKAIDDINAIRSMTCGRLGTPTDVIHWVLKQVELDKVTFNQ